MEACTTNTPPKKHIGDTLNVLCGICSEFYSSNDNIFVTRCGHVFHQQCLFHWLPVSRTCPQCRESCLRHHCHRVYLNFEPVRDDEICVNIPAFATNLSGYKWLRIDLDMDEELLNTFAFHLGTDRDGDNIYIARGYHKNDLLPAYYCPKKRAVVGAWGFKSHFLTSNIEILDVSCDVEAEYKWVPASAGELPENALITGHTTHQEPLYTASISHRGRVLYGKLHLLYGMAYAPFGKKELSSNNYEVLVRTPKTPPIDISIQ